MIPHIPLLALAALLAQPALAEKADRDKPMQLEANRISIDDAKKIQTLEGNVIITKGTLILKAERIVLSEDRYGFQKGTAVAGKGSKATFRQKREGRSDYVEGEAERIEYDSRNEIVELFQRAQVRTGEDEVKGDYIWYDAIHEKFLASAGEQHQRDGAPGRVRAVIQPRGKSPAETTPDAGAESLKLREAAKLQAPD